MHFQEAALALAVIAALAFVGAAPAHASASSRHVGAHRAYVKNTGVAFVGVRSAAGRVRGRITTFGRSPRFVDLVGDRDSGFGFYPLPLRYRIGAWRERQRRAIRSANAIRFAIASTAIYDYAYADGYGYGYHHGIFNPIDGYGTPFFPGYYGGADEPYEDRGPFGRPYN
jgi:hypothetical protein